MNKGRLLKSITFLALLILLFSAGALGVSARENRTSQVVIFSPQEGESRNFYLLKGEIVEVEGTVNGDVYIVAGEVKINGQVNGDVMALARSVQIRGEVSDDVRVVAERLEIPGKIGKNITALTGSLDLLEEGQVSGGLAALSGNVKISAPINGDVKIASQETSLDGLISSDVEVWSEKISLSKTTYIEGDLLYHSDDDLMIQEGASIAGQLTKSPLPQYHVEDKFVDKFNFGAKIISFLGALLVGVVLIKIAPAFLEKVTDVLIKNTLKSGVLGLLFFILVPLTSLLLFVTIVGIPISIILLILYFLVLYLSKIFVSYWIGERLVKSKRSVLAFTLGLSLTYLLSSIPILGGLLNFTVIFLGLGASFITLRETLKKYRKT